MKRVLFLTLFIAILFILNSNAFCYVNIVTVRHGETLGRIASEHHTTVPRIMALNRLHNYIIYPGEKLKVASVGGSYDHTVYHTAYGHYTIKFGDTLSLIAQKYGTSISELRKLNHLYSNVIRQGAVITVPETGTGRYTAHSTEVAYITVRHGETLGRIASEHHTTVPRIMALNRLHNYIIYPGEKLKVASVGGSYDHTVYHTAYGHYTIKFGDTLSLIAQKYGTSISELRKLNHLYSNVIRQGAVITVPETGTGRYTAHSTEVAYITVRHGETLGRIASEHHTTVPRIMALNRLHNYIIYPGEKLKVASVGGSYDHTVYHTAYGHYTIKFGDTLSLIAQKYGTSISELRKLNHLYSNVIRQGAVITVPETGLNDKYGTANNRVNHYKKYSYYGAGCNKPSDKKIENANNNFGLGKKIVNMAYRYKGVPYVWGGTNDTGMDCSGLVQHVFLKLGIHLPRTAAEQSRLGTYVPKDELKPGDLLFFRTYASYISHVGIYIGHGRFIQENSGAGEATINSLSDEYYERTYAFAKAVK